MHRMTITQLLRSGIASPLYSCTHGMQYWVYRAKIVIPNSGLSIGTVLESLNEAHNGRGNACSQSCEVAVNKDSDLS